MPVLHQGRSARVVVHWPLNIEVGTVPIMFDGETEKFFVHHTELSKVEEAIQSNT